MACLFKARINPQSHSPCNLRGVNVFRNQLNFTQMSERKPNITQRKLKTSFDNKSETAYSLFCDCGVCVFSCHRGLNFEKGIGKTNDRRNNELFQWHLHASAFTAREAPLLCFILNFLTRNEEMLWWYLFKLDSKEKKNHNNNNNNNNKILNQRCIIWY